MLGAPARWVTRHGAGRSRHALPTRSRALCTPITDCDQQKRTAPGSAEQANPLQTSRGSAHQANLVSERSVVVFHFSASEVNGPGPRRVGGFGCRCPDRRAYRGRKGISVNGDGVAPTLNEARKLLDAGQAPAALPFGMRQGFFMGERGGPATAHAAAPDLTQAAARPYQSGLVVCDFCTVESVALSGRDIGAPGDGCRESGRQRKRHENRFSFHKSSS